MKAESINIERSVRVVLVDVAALARNWWVVLLRGLVGILFGLAVLFAPEISLTVLVLLFGAFAFVDGILALASAIRRRGSTDRWWVLVLQGLAGIAVGIATAIWPDITALALVYLIAAWALITGGLEIAAAIRLRKIITREWLLALAGIASVALGIVLILFPGPGALALVIWIGAFALVYGTLLTVLAFRLRSWFRARTPQIAAGSA
jgi:uncharacterized membrane protein HdeD (DUF308 family)